MKNIKKFVLIFLIFIFTLTCFKAYKTSKFTVYKMDSDTVYINNDIYSLVTDDNILVVNEKQTLGVACDDSGNISFVNYIFPSYIKSVDTNMDGKFIMVSGVMWDGVFKKK